LAWFDLQCEGKALDVLDRQVSQSSLDGTDVGPVEGSTVGQLFLRDASR